MLGNSLKKWYGVRGTGYGVRGRSRAGHAGHASHAGPTPI
jgi:hypothetical protein